MDEEGNLRTRERAPKCVALMGLEYVQVPEKAMGFRGIGGFDILSNGKITIKTQYTYIPMILCYMVISPD